MKIETNYYVRQNCRRTRRLIEEALDQDYDSWNELKALLLDVMPEVINMSNDLSFLDGERGQTFLWKGKRVILREAGEKTLTFGRPYTISPHGDIKKKSSGLLLPSKNLTSWRVWYVTQLAKNGSVSYSMSTDNQIDLIIDFDTFNLPFDEDEMPKDLSSLLVGHEGEKFYSPKFGEVRLLSVQEGTVTIETPLVVQTEEVLLEKSGLMPEKGTWNDWFLRHEDLYEMLSKLRDTLNDYQTLAENFAVVCQDFLDWVDDGESLEYSKIDLVALLKDRVGMTFFSPETGGQVILEHIFDDYLLLAPEGDEPYVINGRDVDSDGFSCPLLPDENMAWGEWEDMMKEVDKEDVPSTTSEAPVANILPCPPPPPYVPAIEDTEDNEDDEHSSKNIFHRAGLGCSLFAIALAGFAIWMLCQYFC